jgi:type IV pilus assembly protein PilB
MNPPNRDATIDFQNVENVSGETELSPPELFAANLIEWALERRASDLYLSDVDGAVDISIRRLGKIEPVKRVAQSYGHRLQGYLRVLAGADSGDFVRPVEGRGVLTTPDGSDAQLRLSSVPTLFGQDVAIRLYDPIRGVRSLDQLGMDQVDVETLKRLIGCSGGLVLVTGPVASGKSCTLYAMLEQLNDGSRRIHTIEDPIEHSVSGIMQSQINLRAGLDFAELLTAVLRHSPNVIMIGEIRDRKTAETAIRAGASGQLVLATVHAKSAAEAVDMMLQYESDHKFLATALIGVLNQRLIRSLCRECRQPIESPQSLEIPEAIRSRIDDQAVELFRAQGCHVCHEGGYDSLVAVPEIMVVDDAVAEAIIRRATASELEEISRQHGMLTVNEVAQSYVLRGVTSVEEANRALNDPMLAQLERSLDGGSPG